jgi:UDP-N-acetyl-D-galactosamine dehydrogenase
LAVTDREQIAVIGLGYVGLPLMVALARSHDVIGFEIDRQRIAELRGGVDRTGEVDERELATILSAFTTDPASLVGRDIYIVTVPTPVDSSMEPDLSAIRSASKMLGHTLRQGSIVVYESTVYPGVTEDVCGPILEQVSSLECGREFFLGYSPERINPGDRVHSIEHITKVVAGQTEAVAQRLAALYGSTNGGNVFVAANIRTAEAAKVIENAQRDINIAFVNEVAKIFGHLGLSTQDVLAASRTKWNFLDFSPGLVGGHCIGVDPYWLAYAAKLSGLEPDVVLAGRRINDSMAGYVAEQIDARLDGPSSVLVLGLTFKENVPDLRNSKVVVLVERLSALGHNVSLYDPIADASEALKQFGFEMLAEPGGGYDCVVGAVAHQPFADLDIAKLVRKNGLIADIKGLWEGSTIPDGLRRWTL